MKIIYKIILIPILLMSVVGVMAMGIMVLKTNGHELDGSPQFWFVTGVSVTCAMSSFIIFLQLIDFHKNKKS